MTNVVRDHILNLGKVLLKKNEQTRKDEKRTDANTKTIPRGSN
jgi:hypothetical protein